MHTRAGTLDERPRRRARNTWPKPPAPTRLWIRYWRRLSGLVSADQLRPVFDEGQLDKFVVASDLALPPAALFADDDLYRAHELFRSSRCPQLPVVEAPSAENAERDPLAGRIVGMLDYRDMMQAYGREVARRRES